MEKGKARLRSYDDAFRSQRCGVTTEMKEYFGKEVTIDRSYNGVAHILEDKGVWSWNEDWFHAPEVTALMDMYGKKVKIVAFGKTDFFSMYDQPDTMSGIVQQWFGNGTGREDGFVSCTIDGESFQAVKLELVKDEYFSVVETEEYEITPAIPAVAAVMGTREKKTCVQIKVPCDLTINTTVDQYLCGGKQFTGLHCVGINCTVCALNLPNLKILLDAARV